MNLNEQRKTKIEKINELYSQRNSQKYVAKKLRMSTRDVSKTSQPLNYHNTIKKTLENKTPDELIIPAIFLDNFSFLDKYPIENFI